MIVLARYITRDKVHVLLDSFLHLNLELNLDVNLEQKQGYLLPILRTLEKKKARDKGVNASPYRQGRGAFAPVRGLSLCLSDSNLSPTRRAWQVVATERRGWPLLLGEGLRG